MWFNASIVSKKQRLTKQQKHETCLLQVCLWAPVSGGFQLCRCAKGITFVCFHGLDHSLKEWTGFDVGSGEVFGSLELLSLRKVCLNNHWVGPQGDPMEFRRKQELSWRAISNTGSCCGVDDFRWACFFRFFALEASRWKKNVGFACAGHLIFHFGLKVIWHGIKTRPKNWNTKPS